jgi:hypothetical protein
MQITIELINDDGLKLLQQLEQLNILRLLPNRNVKKEVATINSKKRKWAGSISSETADAMHNHV